MPTKNSRFCLAVGLLCAAGLFSSSARAEYHYFSNVQSGSDAVVQEIRWPYWNNAYYNTWLSDDWTSAEGTSGYFYSGLALPSASSPNPVTSQQTVNWSFWPLSNPVNITDTIHASYTSPNTFAMPTIGEGTILRAPGLWSAWQTNVWYRMAFRTWQPVSLTPHLGYAGTWLRDPVTGVWYHMATVQLPFSVTGIDGLMGFQENATGGSQPQRTDYRNCYYHKNGVWNSGNQFYVYNHGGGIENAGLIEANTAVFYETCKSNGVYTGSITNVGQSSPTYTITQSASPVFFDPILVTNYGATITGAQLLVQWQIPATSSPQLAYRIDVYTNASFTGNVVASFFDIAPDTRQKLLIIPGVATPFPTLTIIDIFNQTNAAISLTPTTASLLASTNVSGAVNGLAFSYYESASNIYGTPSGTNWSSMPNFAALTPIYNGAANNLDLTARRRRNGYAFNYTGFLNVPASGLYAFTLNSNAGSKLFVDGQLVANGDGEHSPADFSGGVGLQPGYHAINVQYFCDTQPTALFSDYFDTLTLSYEGPGIAPTIIPDSSLFRVPGTEPVVSVTSPAGSATVSGAIVPLAASVTANGNTITNVRFYVGNNYWAQDATAPYSLNSFFWSDNNNPIRARVYYNGTNIVDSAANLVTTTNMTLAPWQFGQIFYHNYPSGASIAGGSYSLIGDGMNLLTRQVSGDCTLIAHLAGLPATAATPDGSTPNSGWQAGIILRGTTNMTPGYPWGHTTTAPFTAVFGQVGGGAYYQDETMVNGGGGYASANLGGQKWFKIQRVGNTFTNSVSSDGVSWSPVKTNMLTDFGTTLYAGFFTYAGPSSNPNVHWASFNNVSLMGNLVGSPGVTVIPQTDTAYTGQTLAFTAVPSGNAPFTYQWQCNNTNIPGATNASFSLTNAQPSASGLYTVGLSNSNGTASATATLAVLSPPPTVAQVLSNNPIGYWRLNEAAGPTAYDSAGSFNGTGEGGLLFGVPGVTAAPFTGFENGNLAAQFNGTDSDVAIPGMNFTTANFTITGWVKCNGPQTSWSGLVFSRASGFGTGLMVYNNGSNLELRYSWNDNGGDYNFSTGLNLPTNGVWAYVALAIEPTRAIVYLATNSVLKSATNNVTDNSRAFNGSLYFGYDPNSSARRINGALDEIAIYNRTLTPTQISQILAASQQTAPEVSLSSPASGAGYAAPASISLNASVTTNGHVINYVAFYNGASLLGISSNSPYAFTWTNVAAGAYTVFAQLVYDSASTVSSAPAFITVNSIPSAPAMVAATAVASNLVNVGWSASSYASSYILSRNGTAIATLSGTNYLDLGLVANSNYCYSVVAASSYGSSSSSMTSCVTTPATGGAYEWDASGSATGPQDGSGAWGNGATTWWNGSANIVWANNNLAVFGAGTSTNCTSIITNDVTVSGILFNANNGGNYDLSSSANGASRLNFAAATTITANNDATIDALLMGNGQIIKTGPGTLTLKAANTNTGPVIVKAGRLVATVSPWYTPRSIGTGALTVSNGAVAQFTGSHGFGADAGGRSATLTSGGTLQFDQENYVSGLTMTAGSIIGAGEVRTETVTYAINGASTSSLIACDVNLVNSCTFSVAGGAAPVTLVMSGTVSGSGGFTKSGAGLMQLTGPGTYSGTTTISAGTLQVDGSLGTNAVTVANTATLAGVGTINGATTVQSGGTLAPGDGGVGTLRFTNSLTLNAGSKTVLELGKNGAVLSNDLVSVTGALALGGTLTVTNLGGALAAGDTFDLFNAGSFTGSFSSKTLPTLATNLVWNTSQLSANGLIFVAALPVITSQPQSVTVYVNSNATFSVTANGVPAPAYQWSFNGTNLPGAIASTYFVSTAQTTNEGNYTVLVTNAAGSLTSSVARLSLYREFGRAPAPYPSLLSSNGARHLVVPGFQFGVTNSASTDARTNLVSEDGVTFLSPLTSGHGGAVQVVASAAGYLSAWVDYNTNGSWTDTNEQVFTNHLVTAGTNLLSLTVPTDAVVTTHTWARFRLSTATNLTTTGEAPDGEVEDYSVPILANAPPVPPVMGSISQLPDGSFSLIATGAPNATSILLGATNLMFPITWLSLATNTADTNGLFNFNDPQATNYSRRFYRLMTQ